MEDLLSYRLSDLLLFSEQSYYRLFELYNNWLSPFHWLAYLYGAFFLFAWSGRRVHIHRVLVLITALFWLVCVYGFLHQFYAQINWMVSYLTPVMSIQAMLLLWMGIRVTKVQPSSTALILWVVGLIQPVFELAAGRSTEAISAYALTPDSLSICSLALMFMLLQSAWLFLPVFLWLLFSALTYSAMESLMAWYLVFVLLFIAIAVVTDRHKSDVTP